MLSICGRRGNPAVPDLNSATASTQIGGLIWLVTLPLLTPSKGGEGAYSFFPPMQDHYFKFMKQDSQESSICPKGNYLLDQMQQKNETDIGIGSGDIFKHLNCLPPNTVKTTRKWQKIQSKSAEEKKYTASNQQRGSIHFSQFGSRKVNSVKKFKMDQSLAETKYVKA